MLDSRDKKCHTIIHGAATAAGVAGAGLAQIPLADTIPITTIQIGMIIGIGEVFGVKLTEGAAKGLIAGFATSVVGRQMAGLLVGWIPGIGNAIKAGTAGALTEAIGWAAVTHFENLEEDRKKEFKYGEAAAEKQLKEEFCEILTVIGDKHKEQNFVRIASVAISYYISDNIGENIKLLELIFKENIPEELKPEIDKIDRKNPVKTIKEYLVKLGSESLEKLKIFLVSLKDLTDVDKKRTEKIIQIIDSLIKADKIVEKNAPNREERLIAIINILLAD